MLLFAPDFDTVERLSLALTRVRNNLESDGRPTLGLSARDLTALALDANPDCIVIPAHVWTPWYGIFGSKTGFDHLEECFQDMSPQIHAVETGLSSDPAMIWPVPGLADKTIVSFSDAHSPAKLGRELTVFDGEFSYQGLADSLKRQGVAYTAEFYPEEGKYHHTGHRKCGVRLGPGDTKRLGSRCPSCGRPLTQGVLDRVQSLSEGGGREISSLDGFVRHGQHRPPFIRLLPLVEIIADTLGQGPSTKKVEAEYRHLTQEFGSELQVLMEAEAGDLTTVAGERLTAAVLKARSGEVRIESGYDGEYGKIHLGSEIDDLTQN